MERVSSCIVGNIKFLGVNVIPSSLLILDLEDASGGVVSGCTGTADEGTDHLPFALGTLENGYLLGIMADPDQEPGFAPVLVDKSELL